MHTLTEFLASKKNMPVYHGSDVLVKIPRIMQPIRALDFGMLQMLVPMVIQTIIANKKISAIEAVKLFYVSKLYGKLEKESTKLWHLSPLALYELLEIELSTGKLVFPTEA